jgi:formate-dependent nitrite reductase membrane component NrfD
MSDGAQTPMSDGDKHPMGLPAEPAAPHPHEEPPATAAGRAQDWTADHDTESRDTSAALGTHGEPASWRRAVEGSHVALARPAWGDAGWSYIYGHDTSYADAEPAEGDVAAANLRMRTGTMPETVEGPVIHPPVWTWEVPVYFWLGGVASGAAFSALAADLAGDEWTAAIARKVALGAVLPAPALLIADLGRPGRFLNMLRIFKPRSPMNLGAWCLAAFSAAGAAAVGADLVGWRRTAKGLGGAQAVLGSYLGSYTGVLLATTAVPLWARSRIFLGPIFVATATATGAAATRLTLAAAGQPEDDPSHLALSHLEAGAILAELTLSAINERRLGRAGEVLSRGVPGALFRAAEALVIAGLVLPRIARRRGGGRTAQNVASVLYMTGGLAFRLAWVEAGKASARDDEAVALMARGMVTSDERMRRGAEQRVTSDDRTPLAGGAAAKAMRVWTGTVGRASLLVERLVRAGRHPR